MFDIYKINLIGRDNSGDRSRSGVTNWTIAWSFNECYDLSVPYWLSISLTRHGKTVGSGRVGFGSGQSGRGSNGLRVKRVADWVGLQVGSSWPVFFKIFFFFFEVDAICQLFMSSLTIIRFSLVILLPITTKHLTWYLNLLQLLFQLSRN